MKYKILIKTTSPTSVVDYFKFYQVSNSEGDWSSTDKEETIAKMTELLNDYSLSELELVINLDVDITMDIPEIPVSEDAEEEEPTEDNEEEQEVTE